MRLPAAEFLPSPQLSTMRWAPSNLELNSLGFAGGSNSKEERWQVRLAAVTDREGTEDVPETMTMPCCIYVGDADPILTQVRRASERIPNADFFALLGLSYLHAFVKSRSVLPRVMDVLKEGG